ncbi:MAG: hypothetical protein Q9222_007628 [Ikaeria aurantiellina]
MAAHSLISAGHPTNHGEQEEIDMEELSYQVQLDESAIRAQQIRDLDRRMTLMHKCPSKDSKCTSACMMSMSKLSHSLRDMVYLSEFRAGQPKTGLGGKRKNPSRPAPVWTAPYEEMRPIPDLSQSKPGDAQSNAASAQPRSSHAFNPWYGPTMPAQGGRDFESLEYPYDIPAPRKPEGGLSGLVLTAPPEKTYGRPRPQKTMEDRPATAPTTFSELFPPKRDLPFLNRPKTAAMAKEAQGEVSHPLGIQGSTEAEILAVDDEGPLQKKQKGATRATKSKERVKKNSKAAISRPTSSQVETASKIKYRTPQKNQEAIQPETRLRGGNIPNVSLHPPGSPPTAHLVESTAQAEPEDEGVKESEKMFLALLADEDLVKRAWNMQKAAKNITSRL